MLPVKASQLNTHLARPHDVTSVSLAELMFQYFIIALFLDSSRSFFKINDSLVETAFHI